MMNVYFNEYNVQMGDTSYLPLTSGLLRATAEQSETILAHYNFKPFIYAIDSLKTIVGKYYDVPAIAAFSLSMWNEQLSLSVAKKVKEIYSDCLIVMGGAQCPHEPTAFMRQHPFVDVCVRAEGELAFADVLEKLIVGRDFKGIPAVTWRSGDAIHINLDERPFSRDLDMFPSPYLEGLFDDLVETAPFQAIIETNRGCPFHCTFCYWGKGGLSRKYKYYGLERVYGELEWCAKHEIKYIFNADSNFGMNKRDEDIANYLVSLKERTGFPDKFRTCFGKNTDEKIFRIGSLFHKHDLEKGITLARQSNDEGVLKNIKRGNISMDTYRNLQEKFNEENIPIYSELILGLPGETVETWERGIEELLEAKLKNQLFIYFCQVYPNTDLGDPEYQREFGIETVKIELNEIHGSIRKDDWVPEIEEIIIKTNSMTTEEWRKMAKLSWMMMLMHSLKLGYFVMNWMSDRYGISRVEFLTHILKKYNDGCILDTTLIFFDEKLDQMLDGKGRGCVVVGCGDIYWDVEEASFIYCMEFKNIFYKELYELVRVFLRDRGINPNDTELNEMINYQKSRMPTRDNFDGDKERFARESILWARKSGTMLLPEKITA